jgi:hypothetical protein
LGYPPSLTQDDDAIRDRQQMIEVVAAEDDGLDPARLG